MESFADDDQISLGGEQLSLWRDTTDKEEKLFPFESRTLKKRFLGDFARGTLRIGLAKAVILERRLRAKKLI